MKLDNLIHKGGEWLKDSGPESDIVISSRIRLARNIDGFNFLTLASEKQMSEIEAFIKKKLEAARFLPQMLYINMKGLNNLERQFLVERHLISRDHARGNGSRAVVVEKKETLSIMINEEDHLRIQVLRAGFHLSETWTEINEIDNKLEKHLPYTFSPQFGYLTACPTNVGTGMRISVMLHLPALVMTKQIEKVFQALSRIKYTVRGLYGEGSQASGDFYQISNQISLGKSETEVINEMRNVVPEVIKFERSQRNKLQADSSRRLEDRIHRAYGILKHANLISSEETMDLLSAVRLGINLGIIKNLDIKTINELFIFTQPAHLQKIEKRELNPNERDIARAEFIKQKIR